MQYPLKLTFKFWALAPQISVVDTHNQMTFYIRQKLFKLKEVINVFADVNRSQQLYNIKADCIIDFSARYHFADATGASVGSVKRRGLRSLWRAHYDIFDDEQVIMTIQEENPWMKVCDSLLSQLPIVGLFSGYFFNPVYLVKRSDGAIVMRLEKIPSFLSRIFTIKQIDRLSSREETQALLSLMMMLLLERSRG